MTDSKSKKLDPLPSSITDDKKVYVASQWKLMWWKFRDHRLAYYSLIGLGIVYFVALFCEVFAPNDPRQRDAESSFAPPQRIRIIHEGKLHRPFVYAQTRERDPETLALNYDIDKNSPRPIRFWVKGDRYRLWGLFETERHVIGVDRPNRLYLLGADRLGFDLFSRVLYGARVSLSIGMIGVFLSLILGIIIGGISGYYGGKVDMLIQRVMEILQSFPTIPLWLALSAAMPEYWSQTQVYFCMTLILAMVGWIGLARVVRGKILTLRQEDYAIAAKVAGTRNFTIIVKHLVPGFTSHLIVAMTLAVPYMILAETSLSFLGLGLRPPMISWGVLLQGAQNTRAIELYPWMLTPVFFVIVTVLMFNFLGDGLRDAADPYSR